MSDELPQKQIQAGDEKDNAADQSDCTKKEIPTSITNFKSGFPPSLPHSVADSKNSNQETHPANPHPPNWCEKWTLWLEVAGVFGLAFYCWVNWKEWTTFDKERNTMEMEYTNSVAASEKQLSALQGQLDEMKRASKLDERAWVFITGSEQVVLSGKTNGIVRFTCKNFGRTPAIKLKQICGWGIRTNDIPVKEGEPKESIGQIFPNVDFFIESGVIPASVLANIYKGERLYVFGTIWYDDVFGRHHWVRFCYQITPVHGEDFKYMCLGTDFHNASSDDEETGQN